MREALEKCLAHYAMMEKLFIRKSCGDTVMVNGKKATYQDFANEMRAEADLCSKALEGDTGKDANPTPWNSESRLSEKLWLPKR